MAKTDIDWCDEVWNPVYGCLKGCPYCYARKYANRFAEVKAHQELDYYRGAGQKDLFYPATFEKLKAFIPFWLESNFRSPFPVKNPKRIFVNSMSDVNYWEPEWMVKVLDRIREYPQHTFLFLTKFPEIYTKWKWPKNCWLGYSLTGLFYNTQNKINIFNRESNLKFVSIEPLMFWLNEGIFASIKTSIDWVIIGAETGNRKEKVIPKREWIQNIVDFCRENKIPVFLKGSLKDIWGENLIQEWPECN